MVLLSPSASSRRQSEDRKQHSRGPSIIDVSTFAVQPLSRKSSGRRKRRSTARGDDEEYDSSDDDAVAQTSLSSYAGSAESVSESEFSPLQYLSDTLGGAFDASPLDRVIALQAQSSGMLHAKSQEVATLQKEATTRLEEIKKEFASDTKVAKQLIKDLEWAQKRVASLMRKAKLAHPIEYVQASEKVRGF
jgi:hypothetical protein